MCTHYFVQPAVWTLDDLEDESVELIDENTLVEEEDLIKPDPTSLRYGATRAGRGGSSQTSPNLTQVRSY